MRYTLIVFFLQEITGVVVVSFFCVVFVVLHIVCVMFLWSNRHQVLRYAVQHYCHRTFAISQLFELSDEVQRAKQRRRGIVALESTLITHGLPYPDNLRVAKRLEEVVRAENAVPATIALMDGKIRVGLTSLELEMLANTTASQPMKVSLRDVSNVLANKNSGGTTVAATMWIANQAGIKLFATGGIGGVHRGAEKSFDISADLIELGRIPVAVVCAGAKSILDIGKTLEVLETNSVNVIAINDDNFFPGFFTPKTPYRAPFHTLSLEKVVDILVKGTKLNLQGGTLIACPVPAEFAKDAEFIESCVQTAVKEAVSVAGKDVTPFILKRVNELSGSASMKINIALLENNAKIAAKLANSYAEKCNDSLLPFTKPKKKDVGKRRKPNVLCIGASILDIEACAQSSKIENNGGYYRSEVHMRAGGVARNHAEALTKLNCDVEFLSAMGNDMFAEILQSKSPQLNFSKVLRIPNQRTATSIGINVLGKIQKGFIDVDDIMQYITPKTIEDNEELFTNCDFVLIDANLTESTLNSVLKSADRSGKPVWFEPTNYLKTARIFKPECMWPKIAVSSPNKMEFCVLCDNLQFSVDNSAVANPNSLMDFLSHKANILVKQLFEGNLQQLIVTLDTRGCLFVRKSASDGEIFFRVTPAPVLSQNDIISVSGAGDCFNSGYLAGQLHGLSDDECVELALHCAKESLQSIMAVPDSLINVASKYLSN